MAYKNRSLKKIFFWTLQVLAFGMFAQAPSLINYQGSARLQNGIPLGNRTISIKFDIHEGSAGGSIVASETQVVQTNLLGLFTTQIGKTTNISSLNWATNAMHLEVSIDTTGGSNYLSLGTQQMVSTPYAIHAQSVPASYVGNTLTIGSNSFALTPTITATPNTSITVSGLGTVTSAGTNTFDINIPAPTFTGLGTATVSGAYPNYTVSSDVPTFTNTNQPIIIGAYPNFTVNTPTVSAVPDQTITGSGLVNVTNPATNSFVVGVQAPVFTNSGQTIISGTYPNYTVDTPTIPVTPSVSAAGIVTVSASGPNYLVGVPSPTFTSMGTATVTGAYPHYTVSSDVPTFTNSNQPIIVGTYPNFTVNTPTVSAVPDQTITGSGLVNVTNPTTNSFVVNVASPTLGLSSGSITITGGTGVLLPTTPSVSAAGIATVSPGPNYVVGVPAPSLSIGSGSISIVGSNSVLLPTTPSVTAAGIATVSAGPNYLVGVPAPTLGLNSGSITITGGTGVLLPTTPSVSAAGIATVSAGPNYLVGVPAPTLGLSSGSITITGGTGVLLPTTPSVSATGIATVSAGPNYLVGVPAPTLGLSSGSITITGGTGVLLPTTPSVSAAGAATVSAGPNYTVGVPATSIALTATAGAAPSVSATGTNSFNINIPPQAASWALLGNAGTAPATNYLGTSDAQDLSLRTNGTERMRFDQAGNIGIGGIPAYKLDILGTGGPRLRVFSQDGVFAGMLAKNNTHEYFIGIQADYESANGTVSGFHVYDNTAGAARMVIEAGGNAGFGTTAPSAALSVDNKSLTTRNSMDILNARDQVGAGMPLWIQAVTNGQSYGSNTFGRILRLSNVTQNKDYDMGIGSTGHFFLSNVNNYGTPAISVSSVGLVGIAIASPSANLHVLGTTRLVDGTEGAGKVLTSDAIGNASWQAPANNWVQSGNAGTSPATNYIGTSDAQPVVFRTNAIEKMRILANGNVGIGTSAPSTTFAVGNGTTEKFNVNGTEGDMNFLDDQASITFPVPTASAKPMIQMFPSGTTNLDRMVISHSPSYPTYGLQYQDVGDKFNFISNGNPVLTVDLTYQNVGIGTFTPAFNTGANRYLSISSTTNYVTSMAAIELEGGSTNLATPLSRIDFNSATGTLPSTNVARIAAYRTGSNVWGALGFHTSNGAMSERMRIDEDGHIGIGTTLPDYKLSIYGTSASASDGPNMSFVTSQDAYPTMHVLNWNHNEQHFMFNAYYDGVFKSSGAGGNFDIAQYAGKFIIKATGGNTAGSNINGAWIDALMVRNNGFVGIGIPQSSQPSYLFHVQKDDPGTLAYFDNNSVGGGTCLLAQVTTAASSTGARYGIQANAWYGMSNNFGSYSYGYGGTNAYGLYGIAAGASGVNYGLYCSGSGGYTGTWTNVSDRKFKENVKPYTGALNQIMALEPKTYTYKNAEYSYMGFPKGNQIGLIAQEVEAVIPELVENAANPGPLDPETKRPIGTDIEYKSMNYIGLTPILVQAVKEQQAQIEDMKKQLAEQKIQMEEQKKLIDALFHEWDRA